MNSPGDHSHFGIVHLALAAGSHSVFVVMKATAVDLSGFNII